MLKKMIKAPVLFFEHWYNWIQLKRYHVKYGEKFEIHGKIYVFGKEIKIGNNVVINSSYKSNPIGGDCRTILRTVGEGKLLIGDNTGISNSAIISYCSIIIGRDVLIGGSCKIYDTDFHSLDLKKRINNPLEDICSKPVVINDGVFIGAHSIILKGVTIGKNSIVGAGSTVTKSIPEGEIWAGNPARFIRKI